MYSHLNHQIFRLDKIIMRIQSACYFQVKNLAHSIYTIFQNHNNNAIYDM